MVVGDGAAGANVGGGERVGVGGREGGDVGGGRPRVPEDLGGAVGQGMDGCRGERGAVGERWERDGEVGEAQGEDAEEGAEMHFG